MFDSFGLDWIGLVVGRGWSAFRPRLVANSSMEGAMAGGSMVVTVLLGVVAVLLLSAVVVLASIASQLKALRREAEVVRSQLGRMDWSQLIFNGVQHLKEAGQALDTIDKRLQKLEALEKVQLSHINLRAGR